MKYHHTVTLFNPLGIPLATVPVFVRKRRKANKEQ